MNKLFLVLLTFAISSCSQKTIDLDKEKTRILELHNAQREYHFKKDSVAFAGQFADNFIGVGNGTLSREEKADRISRYHRYFSAVEFMKWDDASPPVIRFSDDGSLAYTIVDKIVVLTYNDEDGNQVTGETHYAWTTIYRKVNDEWKIESVTSTEKPEPDGN